MNFVKFSEGASQSLTYIEIDLSKVETYEDITPQLTSAINEGNIALEGLNEQACLLAVTMSNGHTHKIICSKDLFVEQYRKAKKSILLG